MKFTLTIYHSERAFDSAVKAAIESTDPPMFEGTAEA